MNGIGATSILGAFLWLLSAALVVNASATTMLDEASIAATLNEVTELLQQGEHSSAMEDMKEQLMDLTNTIDRLKDLQNKVSQKESEIQYILNQANAKQMKKLEARLKGVLESEVRLREKEGRERQRLEYLLEERKKITDGDSEVDDLVVEVTSTALAERLDTNAILGESEKEMKRWILSVIESEVDVYKTEIMEKASKKGVLSSESSSDSELDSEDCPSLTKIAQSVQQALNSYAEDGIGLTDHAQGASVVHWLTSKTYTPLTKTLGSVWWNQFIPEDWERLLPEGWENWQVGIPSYLSHSLGFMRGEVAPPEAVLQRNTLPGSCWPMEGSSGQIVLKLAYPVVVESFSVDHASSAILPPGKHMSAPKKLEVIGYRECDDGDTNCASVGFDFSDPLDIADIEYDIEGPSVQTFESYYAKAMASLPEPTPSLEEPGSCSTQASCSAPPKISVAAIEVRVLENWGNFDFTCLYRLRVHGEAEKH